MKTYKVNLHLQRNSVLICATAFLATFLLITVIVALSVSAGLSQINALAQSKYEYSATAQDSTLEDTYYQYNAGISFTLTENVQTRFNVDVLMQTETGVYTDKVFWNADDLSVFGVAISKNIAERYKLTEGDMIYSKHIVDGVTRGYTIENILPDISVGRTTKGVGHSDGIIIMGFDEKYAQNIQHSSIIFTDQPIDVVASKCSEMPTNILYREDEIAAVASQILPYLIIYILISSACVAGVVLYISKTVAYNFKRLATCGGDFNSLNRSYFIHTVSTGGCLILASIAITIIVFGRSCAFGATLLPVLCIAISEVITLFIAVKVSNKHLWRK
ncbi:MAG: hypothetical protein GX642_01240 [Smithella sp.]|nr:hypothetical protein [Smithella sp.]